MSKLIKRLKLWDVIHKLVTRMITRTCEVIAQTCRVISMMIVLAGLIWPFFLNDYVPWHNEISSEGGMLYAQNQLIG